MRGEEATDIIDAHHHLWDRSRFPQPWIDPGMMGALDDDFGLSELEPLTRAAGVGGTVLVHVLPSVDETVHLLEVAASSSLIKGVVGWVDLTALDVADQIARLRTEPGGELLVGIRHLAQGQADPAHMDQPVFRHGVEVVGAAGLVLDLVVRDHQLPAVARLAGDVPDTSVVLDHLGKPGLSSGRLDPWLRDLEEVAGLPSVTAKVSGLVTEADPAGWKTDDLRPAIDHALTVFGPQRLMFGSDWPVLRLASHYPTWVRTFHQLVESREATEKNWLWAGTARRVYGLRDRCDDAGKA